MDLHGNVRRNPKLSGTTHNVFGIQVRVGSAQPFGGKVREYQPTSLFPRPRRLAEEEKLAWLSKQNRIAKVACKTLPPRTWLAKLANQDEFTSYVPLGTKESKAGFSEARTVFRLYSVGVLTARDEIAYDFDHKVLTGRMNELIETFNAEGSLLPPNQEAWQYRRFRGLQQTEVDDNLKAAVERGQYASFDPNNIRVSFSPPFLQEIPLFRQAVQRTGLSRVGTHPKT